MTTDSEIQAPAAPPTFKSTFRSGLAFGLGFSLIFVVVFWLGLVVVVYTVKPPSDKTDMSALFKQFKPSSGLTVETQQPSRTKWNLSVLGVVRNDGKEPWQFIRFQINLLAADGSLVGLCEGSASAPLFPGQKRPFQVDCRGSEDHPLPEYNTYTLEIVDASYVTGGGT